MSYLQFLLYFLVAPTALLLAAQGTFRIGRTLSVIGVLAGLAFLYAIPWQHALIERGVWDFGTDKVQATVWRVPLEQYAFVVFQVAFTAALAVLVLRRIGGKP
jgi:lycopene cyclase domain-containing protein